MTSKFYSLCAIAVLLVGCSGRPENKTGGTNLFDWGKKRKPVAENPNALVPDKKFSLFKASEDDFYSGRQVARVTSLVVDRVPGGVLLTATGVTTQAGSFNPRLTIVEGKQISVLEYIFEAVQLSNKTTNQQNIEPLTVAKYLTRQDLDGIKLIQVRSATNKLSAKP